MREQETNSDLVSMITESFLVRTTLIGRLTLVLVVLSLEIEIVSKILRGGREDDVYGQFFIC